VGDKAEFDEFVASRSPHSLLLAFLMTRDWAETEDLQGTREAFDNREQKSMSAIAIWKVRASADPLGTATGATHGNALTSAMSTRLPVGAPWRRAVYGRQIGSPARDDGRARSAARWP
jgi:hypothetical protein